MRKSTILDATVSIGDCTRKRASIIHACGWLLFGNLGLHVTTLDVYAAPTIAAPSIGETIGVSAVEARWLDRSVDLGGAPQGEFGCLHRKLAQQELIGMALALSQDHVEPSFGLTSRAYGFDLWDAARNAAVKTGGDLLLSLTIESDVAREIYLGLGSVDEAVVFLEGRAIFGVVGRREYWRSENLAAISLHRGENEIQIRCRKNTRWNNVPLLHNSDGWTVSLDLYGSADIAWLQHLRHNWHILTVPIVRQINEIRLAATIEKHSKVELLDFDGQRLNVGVAGIDGSVHWDGDKILPLPFVGFIKLEKTTLEPVVILGENSIEDCCRQFLLVDKPRNSTSIWKKRIDHLLKPDFKADRTNWWSRKLCLALVLEANETRAKLDFRSELLQQCNLTSLEYVSYRSAIDQSIQYYRVFTNKQRADAPVLVLMPAAIDPVRPYLESPDVANLMDAEGVASEAEELGLTIIWPGVVDVDFGGDFTMRAVEECLDDFCKRKAILPRVYVLGTCSSGISALRFAAACKVNGLAMQSPEVERKAHRWFAGLTTDEVEYPPEVIAIEDTMQAPEVFSKMQVYSIFNTDIRGHGDRKGCVALCKRLEELGATVLQEWPVSQNEFLWGERARQQYRRFFEWVVSADSEVLKQNRSDTGFEPRIHKMPETVKSALLNGFSIEPSKDELLQDWALFWAGLWRRYRGTDLPVGNFAVPVKTTVRMRKLDNREIGNIRNGRFFEGRLTFNAEGFGASTIDDQDEIWGFRLTKNGPGSLVEVVRSARAELGYPKIDLMIDGCVRGGLWRYAHGEWILVNLWM